MARVGGGGGGEGWGGVRRGDGWGGVKRGASACPGYVRGPSAVAGGRWELRR